MSEFFSNLIDRHLGTRNVVEPRTPSRFETEGVGSVKPLPIDHSGTDETGDENLERQDDLIRPIANDSISADVNASEMEPHFGTPVSRQQDWQSAKPKPVEQTNPKEENVQRQVIHRHSTVETESQRTLPWDLPKRISGMNPTEEASAHTSEFGYHFESELDNRIRTMIARLQDRQNVRPAEHAETNNLDQSGVTKPDKTDDTEKDRGTQPLLVAPIFDESEKIGSSPSDQGQQQAIASTDRDMPWSGSLEPPSWLSEMQIEFNQRWNELNSRPEPEPVINVTIGRVEVRAVQADTPKQTRRQKKPSGVMSLDEYLNQRERRG